MGPSILFDKSAIQSFGQKAVHEVSRYFHTVIPPVLLMEILADLSLDPDNLDDSAAKVTELARKVLPTDSTTNLDLRELCIANLLGHRVEMDRRPVVRATQLVAGDGSKGLYVGTSPENEAVLRWHRGDFSETDLRCAVQWREKAKGANLEAIKNDVLKPPVNLGSLDEVRRFVDLLLSQSDLQEPLLHWLLRLLQCEKESYDRVCFRWQLDIARLLRPFAPYAFHCLRVQLIFYIGMSQGLLGTRSSNIVDLEYLCYTPFASVFCSGDKIHRQLAPIFLDEDQSFVERTEMQKSLQRVAEMRQASNDAEPEEESLIRQLWIKHGKMAPTKAAARAISHEEVQSIMKSIQPIIEAVQEEDRNRQPGPRFPV